MCVCVQDGGPSTESVEERVRELLNDQQTVRLAPDRDTIHTKISLPLSLPPSLPPSLPTSLSLSLSLSLQVSLEDKKEQLLTEFSLSPVKPALQQLLHRYLRYNHHHLPMYSLPDIL